MWMGAPAHCTRIPFSRKPPMTNPNSQLTQSQQIAQIRPQGGMGYPTVDGKGERAGRRPDNTGNTTRKKSMGGDRSIAHPPFRDYETARKIRGADLTSG